MTPCQYACSPQISRTTRKPAGARRADVHLTLQRMQDRSAMKQVRTTPKAPQCDVQRRRRRHQGPHCVKRRSSVAGARARATVGIRFS